MFLIGDFTQRCGVQDSGKYDQGKDARGNPKVVQHRKRFHAGGGGESFEYITPILS
jgi:hypothetical protein